MNGNGNETNPISPYIRPIAAIFFGIVGLLLLCAGGFLALKTGNWQIFFGLTAVALVPVFWFFNIRGGEKAITKMVDMFNTGVSAGKNGNEPPKALSGAVKSNASAVRNTVAAVEEKPQVEYISAGNLVAAIKPNGMSRFDQEKFMAEVAQDASVRLAGQDLTSAAMYYTAKDKLFGLAAPWQFSNKGALGDAIWRLSGLVDNAFKEIWGVDYDTAVENVNSDAGCPTCEKVRGCTFRDIDAKAHYAGMEFWFILRQHREIGEVLKQLP
jgi:hypothetical protein